MHEGPAFLFQHSRTRLRRAGHIERIYLFFQMSFFNNEPSSVKALSPAAFTVFEYTLLLVQGFSYEWSHHCPIARIEAFPSQPSMKQTRQSANNVSDGRLVVPPVSLHQLHVVPGVNSPPSSPHSTLCWCCRVPTVAHLSFYNWVKACTLWDRPTQARVNTSNYHLRM